MKSDNYVSRAELARQVGVGRATLIRWEEAGHIPAARRISYRRALYDAPAQLAIRAFAGAVQ
jgi:DNA-binding transcriptional MerR regulator